jgi:hypothetical protein
MPGLATTNSLIRSYEEGNGGLAVVRLRHLGRSPDVCGDQRPEIPMSSVVWVTATRYSDAPLADKWRGDGVGTATTTP